MCYLVVSSRNLENFMFPWLKNVNYLAHSVSLLSHKTQRIRALGDSNSTWPCVRTAGCRAHRVLFLHSGLALERHSGCGILDQRDLPSVLTPVRFLLSSLFAWLAVPSEKGQNVERWEVQGFSRGGGRQRDGTHLHYTELSRNRGLRCQLPVRKGRIPSARPTRPFVAIPFVATPSSGLPAAFSRPRVGPAPRAASGSPRPPAASRGRPAGLT